VVRNIVGMLLFLLMVSFSIFGHWHGSSETKLGSEPLLPVEAYNSRWEKFLSNTDPKGSSLTTLASDKREKRQM
jgi:hypothetical protein